MSPSGGWLAGTSRSPALHSSSLNRLSTAIRRYDGSGSSVVHVDQRTSSPRLQVAPQVDHRVADRDVVAAPVPRPKSNSVHGSNVGIRTGRQIASAVATPPMAPALARDAPVPTAEAGLRSAVAGSSPSVGPSGRPARTPSRKSIDRNPSGGEREEQPGRARRRSCSPGRCRSSAAAARPAGRGAACRRGRRRAAGRRGRRRSAAGGRGGSVAGTGGANRLRALTASLNAVSAGPRPRRPAAASRRRTCSPAIPTSEHLEPDNGRGSRHQRAERAGAGDHGRERRTAGRASRRKSG